MHQFVMRSIVFVFSFGLCTFQLQAQENHFITPTTETFGTYAVQFHRGVNIPESIQVKYQAQGWSYVIADRQELYRLIDSGTIERIYIEPIGQQTMNDSSRFTHFVNQIHEGQDMDFGFTGKDVIIGYVDTGLDYNHLDFKDSLGNTRVLRYWDQNAPVNFRTPVKYGYGQAFTNLDINNGINPSYANGSHGTTVAGCGSGNAQANGRQKGMAPESSIVVVKNNFNAPSWTLTVAEAVDYIFCVADTFNMPAVVNLSLGTYLGSHDGRDPAALYIDSLLNDKQGRIVVCSAGNSGAWAPYHVRKQLSADTNFVWMIPNASLAYGGPGVYMDLWANADDIGNMYFAFGADAPGPVYRGNTIYRQPNFNQPNIQYDTIYGSNGPIGFVLFLEQVVGPNYNLQTIIYTDSLLYRFRFLATGSGQIDMWSSTQIGGSNFSTVIPDVNLYPEFVYYMMPDLEQSIVSSWACSEQVITVGNVHNRKNYTASNNTVFPADGGQIPSGVLAAGSSKGPNRLGAIKPDIVASGDMSLSARVLNVSYAATMLDIGAMHVRNGGTSMAGPVVAGIAGLYLEKCPLSDWSDFKTHALATAFSDGFTGSNLPNNAYGYGKAHGWNTLLQTEFSPLISGSPIFCPNQSVLELEDDNYLLAVWNTGDSTMSIDLESPGNYFVTVTNQKGCRNLSNTIEVIADTIAPFGETPVDIIVSCIEEVPNADIDLVSNVSDNCGTVSIEHIGDVLFGAICEQYVLRTYRLTDLSGNFTDLTQTINIIDTIPPFGEVSDTTYVPCVIGFPEPDITVVQNTEDNCAFGSIEFVNDIYDTQIPNIIYRVFALSDVCGNVNEIIQVIVITNTFPDVSEISFDGTVLSASENLNYQWSWNSQIIPGANAQTYTPTNGGFYTVSVVDSYGCSSASEPFFVSLVGLSNYIESSVNVYPNPTNESITFIFKGEDLFVSLYDLAGNLLKEGVITSNDSWDVSVLSAGVYFISFGSSSSIKPIKIVKN
jgi:subtilisin family serine protease